MALLIPLASGKGGVGKSVLAANVSHQLAFRGKRTILVDLDWGGSNAHTILGVLNTNPGIGAYMLEKERRLAPLALALDPPGFSFIPGDGQIAGAANLPFVRKQKLLRELAALDADFVVLDLGAGTHSNTVDVFLTAGQGLVVTTPEPTALLNAYGFVKTALFRSLMAATAPRDPARALLTEFFTGKSAVGGHEGLEKVLGTVAKDHPLLRDKMEGLRSQFRPEIVVNMAMDRSEALLGARLRQVCEAQLGQTVGYAAVVPWDEAVRRSVLDRQLLARTDPNCPFSRAVADLAERIVTKRWPSAPVHGTFEDLEALVRPLDKTAR